MRKISEILRQERLSKNLKLEDIERETKIRRSFLEALERGDFKKLPSESYALGFVKTYASFLGFSVSNAAALFRREYEGKKEEIVPQYKKKPVAKKQIFLRSPRGYFIVLLALIIIGYLVFQFSFLFIGPGLEITSPTEGQMVKTNVVEVSGKTDPYATVLVNGEEVYVDLSGTFKKTIYVYSGEQRITVVSKNRHGKESEKKITIDVE